MYFLSFEALTFAFTSFYRSIYAKLAFCSDKFGWTSVQKFFHTILSFIINIERKESIMTGKTHLTVGILTSVSLTALSLFPIEPSHALILIGGAAYGALLPDIDADYSIAKNKFLISSWIYRMLANLFNRNGRKTCFAHRGIMHSLFIPLFTI